MWKFNAQKNTIQRHWDLSTAIALIDKWDGTLLYTGSEYKEHGKIILAIKPIATIAPNLGYNLAHIDEVISANSSIDFPFLFGYVNYDAKHLMDSAELYKNLRDTQFPDFAWHVCEFVFVFDTQWNLIFQYRINSGSVSILENRDIEEFKPGAPQPFQVTGLLSHPDKEQFIEGVRRIHEYIKAGDVYQVNLTRKLSGQIEGDLNGAALALLQSNRIEFGVFYKFKHQYIISTSPERLFCSDGKTITASPIKGTVQNTDIQAANQLLNDKKNLRELAMITDLLRNDLSKICKPGSVVVNGFPILKTLNNVFHLVADIEGELVETRMSNIFKALFPGGSITGCPKIRACQIIEELEQKGRGPYTGSFGYISGTNHADMNILIRTVLIQENRISFNVGGGITLLSQPEDEFEETQHKAKNIVQALGIDHKQ